tara:strand:- start:446 stop:1777 length:1332 start_codon:yes stop_codon:yes gene_type:complete
MLIKIAKSHGIFCAYNVVLFALFCGVFVDSGIRFFPLLLIYFIPFVISYFLVKSSFKKQLDLKFINTNFSNYVNPNLKNILIYGFAVLFIFTIIIHYYDIGFVPVIKAYLSSDYYEVVDIRKQGNYLSIKFVRYLSSFMIKAIIPFLLFYLLITKRYYLFIVIYILGILYAFSLMQKSFVVTILFPCFTYAIFKKQYLMLIVFTITLFSYMFCLLSVTNPNLKPITKSSSTAVPEKLNFNNESKDNKKVDVEIKQELSSGKNGNVLQKKEPNNPSTANKNNTNIPLTFVNSLMRRVFITPGKIVSKWFENIPNKRPFLNGCGYRFFAPIVGCEYQNYSLKLYKNIFPSYAEKGIKGNVNTTSFMYDYSNFGKTGLVLSALVMGFIIAFIDYLFAFSLLCKFSINGFYVLMLSSSALTTLMFSGGWALMIILFYIYRSDFLKLH